MSGSERRGTGRTVDLRHRLARAIAGVADAEHGSNVLVLEVGDVLGVTEYFVIVSASNRRLVHTLVEEIEVQTRGQIGPFTAAQRGCSREPVGPGRLRRRGRARVPRRGPRVLRDRAPLHRRAQDRLVRRRNRLILPATCVPQPVVMVAAASVSWLISRGYSSVGRALPWHGRGQGFDSL